MKLINQNDYTRDESQGLKIIGKKNTVIHCHHYNSRLQRTIEGNTKINGKKIFTKCAAISFYELIENLKEEKNCTNDLQIITDLYSFIGFGTINLSFFDQNKINCGNSHFVEGWKCGSIKTEGPVCRLTEGYLEGAIKSVTGRNVSIKETKCMNQGHHQCEFEIENLEQPKYNFQLEKFKDFSFKQNSLSPEATSNIDKKAIVNAVMNMPIEGNNEGLIPAFNVYLAHMPQDFYNLVSIEFVNEMSKIGLAEIAQEMLIEDAENCALNTFGGIWDSEEWAGLIAPMIKEEKDTIFGLVAVANALGWGKINILEHTSFETLTLESSNGYEAHGYIEHSGHSVTPQCFMLQGITAGLMELVYEKGDLEDRSGKYQSEEITCLTKKDKSCLFTAKIK
ncbi:hypothetical protein N9N67_03885 [Bacteriovoracaceae bacterium]|nr:hypothetical protein [Bacteriovoracaceae bacterium]